jgi:hypothetical protein
MTTVVRVSVVPPFCMAKESIDGIITCAVGGIDTVAGARPCTGVTRAKFYRTMAYEDQQSNCV